MHSTFSNVYFEHLLRFNGCNKDIKREGTQSRPSGVARGSKRGRYTEQAKTPWKRANKYSEQGVEEEEEEAEQQLQNVYANNGLEKKMAKFATRRGRKEAKAANRKCSCAWVACGTARGRLKRGSSQVMLSCLRANSF